MTRWKKVVSKLLLAQTKLCTLLPSGVKAVFYRIKLQGMKLVG